MNQINLIMSANEQYVRFRIKELQLPPIRDAVILGKKAAIGPEAWKRCISLLSPEEFVHFALEDDIIGDVFIRSSLLKKAPQDRLMRFIIDRIKPLANPTEVLVAEVDIEMILDGRL